MNWYVIYMHFDCSKELLYLLNQFDDLFSFKPKVERWFKSSVVQEYQLKDLYPQYLFVRTSLDKKEFMDKYENLLKTVSRLGKLINKEDVFSLSKEEQVVMSKLFQNSDTIKHSIGHRNGKEMVIDTGPLIGFEPLIKKVDRHKRIALLDFQFNGSMMKLPLEIVA